MPKVEVNHLTHTYRNRHDYQISLNNISVTFENSKFNVVLGASGGGKTTILCCIMGLEEYSGTIKFDGSDISIIPPNQRNISYVSQDIVLYPHMNIFKNIAYPLVIRKINKDEIRTRVFEIAKEFEIEELLFRKPKELSVGQCQRVALARAIIKRPALLLCDEPFSNLDKETSRKIGVFLKQYLRKTSISCIFVTHNPEEALRIADTITIFEKGQILISDKPLDVYNNKDLNISKYFAK